MSSGPGRTASAAIAATTLLALAGCGTVSPGAEDPFPPRPFVLDLGAVDACSALTPAQRSDQSVGTGRPVTSQGGTSRGCTWLGAGDTGYNLQTLATDASTAVGADPTGTIVAVRGFGAVQSSPPAPGTGLPFCQLVVDTADGASLRVQTQIDPTGSGAGARTSATLCSELREVTAQMLDTLRARQTP